MFAEGTDVNTRTSAPRGSRRTLVLDADGLTKLASRDAKMRAMVEQEVRDSDSVLVVPIIVVAQALTGGVADKRVREVLRAARELTPVDLERVEAAAALMRASGLRDVVDALVAAEALRRVPSIVITSDPGDIRQLLDEDAEGHRVLVWRV